MSSRPSVYVIKRKPVDGGEPPNNYKGELTVEIRVFAPAKTEQGEVFKAIQNATTEAYWRAWERWHL